MTSFACLTVSLLFAATGTCCYQSCHWYMLLSELPC